VEAASRLFRLRGVDAVGIADLMKDAGLTHGGFYNHFPSKEALAVEVFDTAFANSLGRLAATVRLTQRGSKATSPGSPRRSLAKQLRRVRTSTQPKSARKPSDY
jgi:TetR/AcrR family transcriptional repressor of nem operon